MPALRGDWPRLWYLEIRGVNAEVLKPLQHIESSGVEFVIMEELQEIRL